LNVVTALAYGHSCNFVIHAFRIPPTWLSLKRAGSRRQICKPPGLGDAATSIDFGRVNVDVSKLQHAFYFGCVLNRSSLKRTLTLGSAITA
jgi:hypothetical protein